MARTPLPFDFVLDYLHPLPLRIRRMFGCHAIYRGDKLVLVVRKKADHPEVNGIWISTQRKHHASLAKDVPSLGSVTVLDGGKGETNWRLLHEDDERFEELAIRICELIRDGDERIGSIPKGKKRK